MKPYNLLFKPYSLLLILAFFQLFLVQTVISQVKINEIVASNSSSLLDEDMESPDWIELFNSGTIPVNLKDYRLSDKKNFQKAWIFPDTILQPGKYMIVFAADSGSKNFNNYLIKASGTGIGSGDSRDGFNFHYVEVEGDFDLSVKIHSMRNYNPETRVQLMIREKLSEGSPYVGMVAQNPDIQDLRLYTRKTENTNPEVIYFWNTAFEYPYGKLRLQRKGDSVYGYTEEDKYYWYCPKAVSYFPPNAKAYLGIAFSSADDDDLAELAVSGLMLNDNSIDPATLKSLDINTGIKSISLYSHELHADFKLNSDEETLYLWNRDGFIEDSLFYGKQRVDVSYGRIPDGSSTVKYLSPSTPEISNANPYSGFTKNPEFSNDGGFYNSKQEVYIINSDPNTDIYYTLNGADPTKNSKKYSGNAISVDTTTVIRARAYKNTNLPSDIVNNSYFIKDSTTTKIISFVTDPANLYDPKTGIFIYDNLYKDIEIPCHIELWDTNGIMLYEAEAGAKLNGAASRKFDQKSFRIYAKSKYGNSTFDYPFFDDKGLKQYDRLLLRNGGTEWWRSLIRDEFAAVVAEQLPNMDAMAYTPTVMFLNGSFYGITNLRERIDETYIQLKYNLPADKINVMEDWGVLQHGTSKGYHEMFDSILVYDMQKPDAYSFIDRNLDISNITEYVILELYLQNIDWPWKNLKYWNSGDYDGKWRWILNDMDWTCGIAYGADFNNFYFATEKVWEFSKMFPKLLENDKFRFNFINRTADLINTVFLPENITGVLDSLARIIEPEIPRQQYKYDSSAMNWSHEIDVVRDFLEKRPKYFPGNLVKSFELAGTSNVTLDVLPETSGKIKISAITPQTYPWQGIYFQDVPVRFEAVPKKGYKFVSWSNDAFKTDTFTVLLSDYFSISANFVKDEEHDTNIVINEIMYKAKEDHDSGDWIELYNAGGMDVDISGWIFKDDKDEHQFIIADNTVLKKDKYIVLSNSIDDFSNVYPEITNVIGDFDFGLGTEDHIRLYSQGGYLRDNVNYSNKSPWPLTSDGTGNSIELINPLYENNLSLNWYSSKQLYGTPGQRNSVLTDTGDKINQSEKYKLRINPNPIVINGFIEIELEESETLSLELFNILGQKVETLVNEKNFSFGNHKIPINIDKFPLGLYFLSMKIFDKGTMISIPMIIAR